MFKKLFVVVILVFVATGGAFMTPLEVKGEKEGKSVPVITQSFASTAVKPGETWKVYVKAFYPDGEMKNLYAEVFQYGRGPYPISITRIKEGNGKELSGYFYLNTGHDPGMNFVNLIVTLNIQDKAGSFSAPAVFPVAFNTKAIQEAPPAGVFPEKDLGPIMVTLRSSDDGDHKDRFFR